MKKFWKTMVGSALSSICISGYCLDERDGTRALENRDPFLAVKIWTKLAEQGDIVSQSSLGWIYKVGFLKFKPDWAKSLYWLKKCEPKLDVCALEIASMYEEGLGVEKDIPHAVKLYERVLEHDTFWPGLNEARVRLALLHFSGEVNGSVDRQEAQRYMLLAANEGSFKAKNWMGDLLTLDPNPSRENLIEAYKWHLLATAHDELLTVISEMKIKKIEKKMSPEDVRKAWKLAKDWRPTARSTPTE